MKYRLPCSNCESVLIVQAKDAGRELPCPECNVVQKLPSMGAIRRLDPDSSSNDPKREKKWSLLQGLSFGLGMICLISSIIGVIVYLPTYRETTAEINDFTKVNNGVLPDYTDITPVQVLFEKMPTNQLWDQWRDALKTDTDQWAPSKLRVLLDKNQASQNALYGFAGLAALGVAAMVTSFFLP